MDIKTLELDIPMGYTIVQARDDAVIAAVKHKCTVTFRFNELTHSVQYSAIMTLVTNREVE